MRLKHKITVFLVFSLVSLFVQAAIPPQEVLETHSIRPVAMPKFIKPEDIALVIPTNLQPGNDEDVIMTRIMDHSINTFLRGDYLRGTEFGKAATTIENAMKTEVSFGSSGGEDGEPAIQHKINLQVQALEQKAYISYSGLTNINMNLASSGLDITMQQPIDATTTLVLSHHTHDAISRINMLWAW